DRHRAGGRSLRGARRRHARRARRGGPDLAAPRASRARSLGARLARERLGQADCALAALRAPHRRGGPLGSVRALGAEFPDGPQLGCVIQAYRKDAWADLQAMVAWSGRALARPLAIRLVKGAYWDTEVVIARAAGWP